MAPRVTMFQFTLREGMFAIFTICMALGWGYSERWNQWRYDEMYERYRQQERISITFGNAFKEQCETLRKFEGKLVRIKVGEKGRIEVTEENP